MKILFATNMYPTAEMPASGTFVWQQAEQLRQLGHTVDVVSILGFQSKLNYLIGAVEIFQKTRAVSYDVVHAHYGYTAFAAWWRVQAPLVVTLHGSDLLGKRIESFGSRMISRCATTVILVSEEMRRYVSGVVIPCGVDLDLFKPHDQSEARMRLQWPKDKYVVLFPFDPTRLVKRYDLAKAAVERLREDGLGIELRVVSDTAYQEMPWYYCAADVMILCSDREGSPTAVKEAMACDLPVVATDVGDVREILGGLAGTRICTQEVSDIAQKLREVLVAPRNKQFERRAAMTRYDQALIGEKILNIYERAISEFKSKH